MIMEAIERIKSALNDTTQAVMSYGNGNDKEQEAQEEELLVLLKEEHDLVDRLFQHLEALKDSTDQQPDELREGLFSQLRYELTLHAELEERLVYPAFAPLGAELVAEAREEHALVKALLEELSSIPFGTVEWNAKLEVLRENVEHHVQEEEDELFPAARDKLGEERLRSLGRTWLKEKQALAVSGIPA